jgi:hypothetical protein
VGQLESQGLRKHIATTSAKSGAGWFGRHFYEPTLRSAAITCRHNPVSNGFSLGLSSAEPKRFGPARPDSTRQLFG